jgi:hypothetical protein
MALSRIVIKNAEYSCHVVAPLSKVHRDHAVSASKPPFRTVYIACGCALRR